MRGNQSNMVDMARRTDRTVHASSWRAIPYPRYVSVYHYSTLMFDVMDDGSVVPISRGWGSMSDKHGTRRILEGCRANVRSYREVYG